jgi:beta-N-acetylhexosaminidase
MIRSKHIWRMLCSLVILLQLVMVVPVNAAKAFDAETVLEMMTPEEKIGQLFLVTFDGMDVEEGSQIYDLIIEFHVGGVVLRADNNNFPSENTISATQEMVTSLQDLAWASVSEQSNIVSSGSEGSAA